MEAMNQLIWKADDHGVEKNCKRNLKSQMEAKIAKGW